MVGSAPRVLEWEGQQRRGASGWSAPRWLLRGRVVKLHVLRGARQARPGLRSAATMHVRAEADYFRGALSPVLRREESSGEQWRGAVHALQLPGGPRGGAGRPRQPVSRGSSHAAAELQDMFRGYIDGLLHSTV